MNEELQLKLQAYLDGELTGRDAEAVRNLLAADEAARSLMTELANTRSALRGHESALKVPESRDFYWSKIRRQIDGEAPVAVPSRPEFSLSAWLSRILVPAGAAAGLIIAVMLSLPHSGGAADYTSTSGDTATFTYHNYDTGSTLVWLDYSSLENDFSDAESDDTLDL